MSKKLDLEAIRQAAAGRWLDILQATCGLTPEQLDPSRHGPCPKCGGDDRFRAFDDVEQTGGVICNQCHSDKNGDGFATVAWAADVKFPQAITLVADYLGLAPAKGEADPAKDLAWAPWSSQLAQFFLAAKPGVTEAGLLLAGARMARYKRTFTVIAMPIIGHDLDTANPVGWALYNYNAAPLPKYNRQGEVIDAVKVKITYGSKPGLVGLHGVKLLKTPGMAELCWKVEGVTDCIALQSLVPEQLRDRHAVVTNSNGAGETPRWQPALLGQVDVNVVHDADKPGQSGAVDWTQMIALQSAEGRQARNIQLPYEIAEKHGQDLRDYIEAGHSYGDVLALADRAIPFEVKRTATGEVDYSAVKYPLQELILKKLQLEVLYEDETGAIRVFSTFLRKASTIKQVDRVGKATLVQICGPPAKEAISKEPDGTDTFSIEDAREAIALAASTRRGKHNERGVGVWQGLDDYGNETETVVLVNAKEGARWNGDRVLRRVVAPRADGLVLDLGTDRADWYEFDTIERYMASAADVEWRVGVIQQAVDLFGRWRWKNQEVCPDILAGLVMATWIQTVWAWRPLVAISGATNSGKSLLFECLGGGQSGKGIFGNLAFKQAKSTCAGVLQGLGNTGQAALCDEFEAGVERDKTLEAFRQSSRGDSRATGTASQKHHEIRLCHIAWIAAIETGLARQPDNNRFIQFELLEAMPGQHGQLRLPPASELVDLGQKLLAIAIHGAIRAKRLAVELKGTRVQDVDPRVIESYAVPAAMLTVAFDEDQAWGAKLLERLTEGNVDRAEQGKKDQDELLDAILTASVFLDGRSGVKTVNQVLESPSMRDDHGARLEAAGVRLLTGVDNIADYSLFVAPKLVQAQLLKDTPWAKQRIDQILLRLPGAERRPLRIAGRVIRGLVVPPEIANIHERPESFY